MNADSCSGRPKPQTNHSLPPHVTSPHSEFYASDMKMMRTALSSFFDMVAVSVKTLLEFYDDE